MISLWGYRHALPGPKNERGGRDPQAANSGDIVYDDSFSGIEMQDLAECIKITGDDTIVSSLLDGAQLYQNKKSDGTL